MAITIKHLSGPLAGQKQHFDDSVAAINFGRSPECHVVYPVECVEVGRKHCALLRAPGGFRIELFGQRYVAIDGLPVENGTLVRSGSVCVLGRPGGPSFRAELDSAMADIAYSARNVDDDQPLARNPTEPFETAVDLLFKRRSEPPAVVAGIAAGAAFHPHFDPAPSFPPPSPAPASSLPEMDEMPATRMATARRTGALWWVIAAAALAALGYVLYRREIVLGAAIGKLLHAALPPQPAAKPTKADLVDVSVFGPTAVKAGGEGLIQVFLHHLSQREIAKALAQETDPDAVRRGTQTLAAEIAQGQRVEIILEGRGLDVDQPMQSLVWRSEPCACQFTVTAPKHATGRTLHPRVLVLVNSVPVGSLTFTLKVTEDATAPTEMRGDRARRYTYAFLSYASPDRAEVIKRAQGLKAGGTSFFNDLLSLEPGERWEQKLYEQIDRCDVFYLFWSTHAKASKWVTQEIEYALARSAASPNGEPDIIPVIIEGPPPPTPPDTLKDIHFNDSLIYVLAGLEGARPPR